MEIEVRPARLRPAERHRGIKKKSRKPEKFLLRRLKEKRDRSKAGIHE